MSEMQKDAGYFSIDEKNWRTDTLQGRDMSAVQDLLKVVLNEYDDQDVSKILTEVTPTVLAEVTGLAEKINSDIAKQLGLPLTKDDEVRRLATQATERINTAIKNYADKKNPDIAELANEIRTASMASEGKKPTDIAKDAVRAAGS